MIDFVIGLLHGLAFAFLVYGAYLAVSWTSARGAGREARAERRQRIRRKADRRKGPRQDAYGVPM